MPIHESQQLKAYLSGNDAIRLLEIIHKSLSCNTEGDFAALFPKFQELFPFDFAGALMGNHDDANGLVIIHGVNVSFPEEWHREYLSKNYLHKDILTKETFRICKPRHWSYMTQNYDVPKEIMSLNMDIGAKEALSHGTPPSVAGGKGSIFCFAGPLMEHDKRTITLLELLIPHLHLSLSNIFKNKETNINNAVLSAREKEVLNWLKQGKSSWDISVILGISESTTNFHVYNIMRKLDASNRPQAVAVAARLGLIGID